MQSRGHVGKFINSDDGRKYFIDKDCYLELVNKNDLIKIQGKD